MRSCINAQPGPLLQHPMASDAPLAQHRLDVIEVIRTIGQRRGMDAEYDGDDGDVPHTQ